MKHSLIVVGFVLLTAKAVFTLFGCGGPPPPCDPRAVWPDPCAAAPAKDGGK